MILSKIKQEHIDEIIRRDEIIASNKSLSKDLLDALKLIEYLEERVRALEYEARFA